MNKDTLIGIGGLLLAMALALHSSQVDFPKLTGPYLGQKPPGKTPEPFAENAPELQNLHGMIRFSPDGKEAYWKPVWSPVEPILVSKMESGEWTRPTTASFSAANQGDDSPFLSPDGKKLFFISQRPPVSGERSRKERIWVTERISEGWSEPRPLPDVINSMNGIHWQFSVDNEGNLYFGARSGHEGEIFCAKYQDGQYRLPEKLGPEINTAGIYNYAPYIHPDGRLLLFSRSRAKDPAKIFVSVKRKDGTWTEAKMLFDNAARPVLTPDGKYLFFARGDGITCWVDAGFIEELRPSADASVSASGEAPEKQMPKLSDKLSAFKPFIGPTWVGSVPDDSRMGEITLKWEIVLNGFAVRLSRHVLKFDHWLETTYYWDEVSGKIAYLAVSNNGVVIKGYFAGDGAELISEGDQRGPDVKRKVRRIYRLEKDGKLYEDDQFRNSDAYEWRRTHISVFVAK